MLYRVKKTDKERFSLADDWDQGQWADAEVLEINNYMGSKPAHFPLTKAKLLWSDKKIYVFFKVDDKYVRSVTTRNQGPVCRDSCVEFFFSPSGDIAEGYFNLEMNCCGYMLLYHQKGRDEQRTVVRDEDLKSIKVISQFSPTVDPEVAGPLRWTLKYELDIEMLEKYASVKTPANGVRWKANFYKCADESSHPHWLTWNKVGLEKPDFHQPGFFGDLEFV